MIGLAFTAFYAFLALACLFIIHFTRNMGGWLRGMAMACVAFCVGLGGLVAGLSLMSSGNWDRPIGDPLPNVVKEQVEIVVREPASRKANLQMPSPTMRTLSREEQEIERRREVEAALRDARREADMERRRNMEAMEGYGRAAADPPPQGELSRYHYDGDPDFSRWKGVREREPEPYPVEIPASEDDGEEERHMPVPPGEGGPSHPPLPASEVRFPQAQGE